jgi:hypothetical protein
MPVSAPSRVQFNVAPQVFEDPDISFNDLDEQVAVTNLSKREVIWRYAKREYVLKPNSKPSFIKLEVCIKYLGDPRSAVGVQNTYRVPGDSQPGTVPERYKEIRRLAILYGVYEGMMSKLASVRYRDIPRDRMDPDRDLFPDMDKNDTIVPKIKVTTLTGAEVKFPIYYPDANPYRYDTEASGMSDVRTELERSRRQYDLLADKIAALEDASVSGEADIPPAEADSVGVPGAD